MNAAAGAYQTALFTLLNGDVGAGGLRNPGSPLVLGVFDFGAVPQDQPHPYLTIGDMTSVPWGTMRRNGEQIVSTVHIWTQSNTEEGFEDAHAILNRVNQLIGDAAMTVSGYVLARSLYERYQTVSDPDPKIQHIAAAYRVWLQEA